MFQMFAAYIEPKLNAASMDFLSVLLPTSQEFRDPIHLDAFDTRLGSPHLTALPSEAHLTTEKNLPPP
jgi:hypothetical protein